MGIYAILRREMDKTELNTELVALMPQMDHALKIQIYPQKRLPVLFLLRQQKPENSGMHKGINPYLSHGSVSTGAGAKCYLRTGIPHPVWEQVPVHSRLQGVH